VLSIDGQTGIFTTNSANLRSSGNWLDLSAARSTLPTVQRFTSGSGTYTKPAGVAVGIRIRVVAAAGAAVRVATRVQRQWQRFHLSGGTLSAGGGAGGSSITSGGQGARPRTATS